MIEWPDKEELEEMLKTNSMADIALKLGTSVSTVSKHCARHYIDTGKNVKGRRKRTNKPTLYTDFWKSIEPPTECWKWQPKGTGIKRKVYEIQADRLIYTLFRGPVPRNAIIDRTCKTPKCMNPNHMKIREE